jgi:hypothetical protein
MQPHLSYHLQRIVMPELTIKDTIDGSVLKVEMAILDRPSKGKAVNE